MDRSSPLHLSFFFHREPHLLSKAPNQAGRALPMAELLPLLSGAPPLTQGGSQASLVSPAEWQSQQPQDEEPWRLLEVPSIQITPSSDGESPHCTPRPQHLQLLRTSDMDSLLQDR